MTLTHWKKLENPDYIGAYAFQPGEKKTLTISRVAREMVNGPDGKREECTVVHFAEAEKPLILNVTNAKMISRHAGTPYIEQWSGTRIMLGVEKVKAFGDMVEAVRVQKSRPAQPEGEEAPVPPCADCSGVIEGTDRVSARAVVNAGLKKYGAPLCVQCALKRAEKLKEEAGHANDQNQDQ